MNDNINKFKYLLHIILIFLICFGFFLPSPVKANNEDFSDFSIEDLMNLKVTSVSKKAQNLSDTATAIFVITADDIKQSGATNIPDILRMVPGLNIARIDSNKWGVNTRSATSRFADKLLVLLDGRVLYSPSFSGVYWEVQDIMLEDVGRIEVIRGPGATLWGANAVNGVINIISKHAKDTQGSLISFGGGTVEKAFASARHGIKISDETYARFYAKGFKRDGFHYYAGGDASDEWGTIRGGFRLDSKYSSKDSLTIQGDIYRGEVDQRLVRATSAPPYSLISDFSTVFSGADLITRWQRVLSSNSDYTLQAYYDRTTRKEGVIQESRNSIDVDFQYRFKPWENHDIVSGIRFYYTSHHFSDSLSIVINPSIRRDSLFSIFLQDELQIIDDSLWVTFGSKFEKNDYSNYEMQPSARILWVPHVNHRIWSAVSHAVRTPSRVEHDGRINNLVIPPFTTSNPGPMPLALSILGNPRYDSEELMAYEVGYRYIPNQVFSVDIATFYFDYDNLRTTEMTQPVFYDTYLEQPLIFTHNFKSNSYGGEISVAWQVYSSWKLDIAYSYLVSDLEEGLQLGKEPMHQVSLRSDYSLGNNVYLHAWLRYVDEVNAIYSFSPTQTIDIDDYIALDLHLNWKLSKNTDISLIGQNLLDNRHLEFVQENFTRPTEVPRSFYIKITLTF